MLDTKTKSLACSEAELLYGELHCLLRTHYIVMCPMLTLLRDRPIEKENFPLENFSTGKFRKWYDMMILDEIRLDDIRKYEI